jgi:hypothetical protein
MVWPFSNNKMWMKPTTGIAGCCARAATGHAAAPPNAAMNSRRLVCRERTMLKDDGGRFTSSPPSWLEARSRLGCHTAHELGAPVVSSIPGQLPSTPCSVTTPSGVPPLSEPTTQLLMNPSKDAQDSTFAGAYLRRRSSYNIEPTKFDYWLTACLAAIESPTVRAGHIQSVWPR